VTLKSIAIEKHFFPSTSKIILFPWIMISATLRVIVLVLYFTPGFGLFSILGHWKSEQIPYGERYRNLTPADVLYIHNANVTWSDMNRWDYSDPTNPIPPPYSLYTAFTLTQYFIGFWIILFLHVCCNIIIKRICSKHFRKNCKSVLAMVIHGLENTNLATVWRDWDVDNGTIHDHKERHSEVVKEMVSIMINKAVFHTLMLGPIIFTATTIWARHSLLMSVGVLDEEQVSYDNVTTLFYLLYFFPVLSILEIVVYCAYQYKV